jgi:hypothetical protein
VAVGARESARPLEYSLLVEVATRADIRKKLLLQLQPLLFVFSFFLLFQPLLFSSRCPPFSRCLLLLVLRRPAGVPQACREEHQHIVLLLLLPPHASPA